MGQGKNARSRWPWSKKQATVGIRRDARMGRVWDNLMLGPHVVVFLFCSMIDLFLFLFFFFYWSQKPNDHQEKVEILKSKLSEETEWRMQLIHDLEITQKALKDEKKVCGPLSVRQCFKTVLSGSTSE